MCHGRIRIRVTTLCIGIQAVLDWIDQERRGKLASDAIATPIQQAHQPHHHQPLKMISAKNSETLAATVLAVCPGCSCLCDDIEWVRTGNQIIQSGLPQTDSKLCEKGKRWFAQPVAASQCTVDGVATDYDQAIHRAIERVQQSKMPLICGLEGLSVEGQQAAMSLADRMRASIDVSLLYRERGSSIALERTGLVTSTLGEVDQRSDWILFWFCDPAQTHPRLLERFCTSSSLLNRRIVVVDSEETETARQADWFIKSAHESGSATLSVIRALISNVKFNTFDKHPTGQPLETWQNLAAEMLAARYGTIFFRPSASDSDYDSVSDQLHRLVRAAQQQTRCVLHPLHSSANGVGAENVMAWSSGYPFAVNFNRSFPRYYGREYSAEGLLERGECDLVILASTGQLEKEWQFMSSAARDHFERVPKIVLEESPVSIDLDHTVKFPVTRCGDSCHGDMFRQDGISIPLPNLRDAGDRPSAIQVLNQLETA